MTVAYIHNFHAMCCVTCIHKQPDLIFYRSIDSRIINHFKDAYPQVNFVKYTIINLIRVRRKIKYFYTSSEKDIQSIILLVTGRAEKVYLVEDGMWTYYIDRTCYYNKGHYFLWFIKGLFLETLNYSSKTADLNIGTSQLLDGIISMDRHLLRQPWLSSRMQKIEVDKLLYVQTIDGLTDLAQGCLSNSDFNTLVILDKIHDLSEFYSSTLTEVASKFGERVLLKFHPRDSHLSLEIKDSKMIIIQENLPVEVFFKHCFDNDILIYGGTSSGLINALRYGCRVINAGLDPMQGKIKKIRLK